VSGAHSAQTEPPAPKRKGEVKRKHTVGRVVLVSTVVLALVTALSVVFLYRHLNGNIDTESFASLGDDRPEKVYRGNGEPLNILVMGDDTRSGEGNDIDSEAGGGGSDTTILVHLSADRSRAYAISIPRDSIVDRPECEDSDAVSDIIWNQAFSVGGPLCTVAQVEENTDVFVDHFVTVDFNGFGEMVDAVGGVPVCVPEDIEDPKHQIFVPAGDPSLLTGDEALDYVRARYVGELSQQNDISRIRRQQTFIAALVREVKSAGTLTRLDKVVKFLDAATSSLTTDEDLGSVTRIGKIAMQLQNIGLDEIQFVTVPNAYYPRDSEHWGRVYWTDEATELWQFINEDKPLPKRLLDDAVTAEAPSTSSEAAAQETESPSESPSATEQPEESPTETATPSETASPSETATPSEEATPTETVPGVCA
jgi:LCP family protein required for cell wall assembly